MKDLLDNLGGRKFMLALVIFVTGTVLAAMSRLTYEWVALASTVLGIYGISNAAVHRGYAAARPQAPDGEVPVHEKMDPEAEARGH